jgi:uncharacterized protein YdaU (DUF1376 family)
MTEVRRARHWMPLWVADYLADTMHLDTSAHGAYLLLIMAYWRAGGLPDDDQQLCRIVRMTPEEWATARPTIAAFFGDGWRHGRIDAEIAKAEAVHSRRSEAGRRGGTVSANGKPGLSKDASKAQANDEQGLSKADSKAQANEEPGAAAPLPALRDIRGDLFNRGLKTLATITGKTPDSCRSLVGRWLKSVNDEAVHVLGAIDDAERNRVADPVAWITQALKSRGGEHGKQRSVQEAARDLVNQFGRVPAAESSGARSSHVRVLPEGRRE